MTKCALSAGAVREIALGDVIVSEQVRKTFDPEFIQGLAASIQQVGQIAPVLVRQVGDKFSLIAGEQRFQALKLCGAKTVRAIVIEGEPTDGDTLVLQLVENMQRADLCPIEVANGIQALMAIKGVKAAAVATQLGISPAMVTKYLGLLKLPEPIQAKVVSGEIGMTAAYDLSRVTNAEDRDQLADDLSAGRINRDGLAKAIKARTKPVTAEKPSTVSSRATASLPGGRTVTVVGPALDLEAFIAALEELLGHARKERSKGIGLSTFVAMLRDQSLKSTLVEA